MDRSNDRGSSRSSRRSAVNMSPTLYTHIYIYIYVVYRGRGACASARFPIFIHYFSETKRGEGRGGNGDGGRACKILICVVKRGQLLRGRLLHHCCNSLRAAMLIRLRLRTVKPQTTCGRDTLSLRDVHMLWSTRSNKATAYILHNSR